MPSIGDLFGEGGRGTGVETVFLWTVASAVVASLFQPALSELQQEVWDVAVDAGAHIPITPADLATMVVKNIKDLASAEDTAKLQGVTPSDFDLMVTNTGEPLGLETVLEAYRRGYIQFEDQGVHEPSVTRAVLTGRTYDYWLDTVQQLASRPISPGDAVDATLRGQRAQADMETEAYASGIDADRFQILLDTAGRPPGPAELIELVRRGLIPTDGTGPDALTLQQGIFEGDSKDKWWSLYKDLVTAVPPPRTVTTLLSHGAIGPDLAAKWFADAGLDSDAVEAYVKSATTQRISAHTAATEAQILKGYYVQLLTAEQATGQLESLGYPADTAGFLLELQDYNRSAAAYESAVNRVGTLYVGKHIDRQSALDALGHLAVPAASIQHYMGVWDQQAALNLAKLSKADITDAYEYGNMEEGEALQKLGAIGYTPYDAWVVLSNKNKQPLPDKPAFGAAPGGATPVA
jgi:hypothetical protein